MKSLEVGKGKEVLTGFKHFEPVTTDIKDEGGQLPRELHGKGRQAREQSGACCIIRSRLKKSG